MPPTAPAAPPSPTTDPTACRGNMSEAVVKRFADQPWWAAAARLTMATAPHRVLTWVAKAMGVTQRAHRRRVAFRAPLRLAPRARRTPGSQPPPTLPTEERT